MDEGMVVSTVARPGPVPSHKLKGAAAKSKQWPSQVFTKAKVSMVGGMEGKKSRRNGRHCLGLAKEAVQVQWYRWREGGGGGEGGGKGRLRVRVREAEVMR